jgi:hypothetical protein
MKIPEDEIKKNPNVISAPCSREIGTGFCIASLFAD